MKKKQHIQLVPNAHIPCMRTWCGACRTMVKTCQKNGKELSACEHIEKLQYRFVAFIPNTKIRIVRSLGKDFNSAVKQVATLRQQIENGEIGESTTIEKRSENISVQNHPQVHAHTKPVLLTHLFGKYLSSLKGEGIASHLKLVRSKSHVNDVKNCFNQFGITLKKSGYDVGAFRLIDISDEVIGKFHDHIIIGKGYSNSTYNRFFSHLTTFASWAEGEEYGNVKRFFERVPRKTVTPRPEVIMKEEFEKVLSSISHENGFQRGIGKRKASRNHYRDYLIPAFRFALYTGRRLEEIITVKFSDIHTDEKGRPLYITFTDHKVNRILHVAPGEERELHTPVTNEIAMFLNEQGFQQKNTDDYILAPEIKRNRTASMRLAISRGFSHYWKVAFPDSERERTFKNLRKTYLTALASQGKNTREVSGHSSDQILKNYIDEKQVAIAGSLEDFSVFGDLKTEKKNKREIVRRNHTKEDSIEINPP